MGEDPQRIKRIAAASYDYESDPKWAEYWGNILIPPHMSSRSDVVDHYKRKFYQRFIDPDFVVEPMSVSSSSQTARPSTTSSSSSSATNQARPRNSGSSGGTSAQPGTGVGSARWDRQTIQFSVNAWVFIVGVLAIFPLVPKHLSLRAYRLSLLGTACSSFYSLYSLYGKPRAWNLQAIQMWFHYVLSLLLTSLKQNFVLACLPLLRKYLEDPCLWVESNLTTLNILSSNAEVGLGFFLIISLLSWQRNILQTVMYWQLLKLMYFAPVTAGYHQSVWAKIGRSLTPIIYRYAPFLNTPLSAVQRWWFR